MNKRHLKKGPGFCLGHTHGKLLKALLKPAALAVVAAFSSSLSVQADPIAITNPSFETGGTASVGTLVGWTPGDASNLYYTRESGPFIVASVGDDVAALVGNLGSDPVPATLSQTTTFKAEEGDTFTLAIDDTYDLGSSGQTGDNAPFALTIGGVPVAFNPDNGSQIFASGPYGPHGTTAYNLLYADSLTYTVTNSAYDGENVGVEVIANDGDNTAYFDDVRLSVQTVPEPSTWAMLIAGFVAMLGLRRFTRKA